MMKSLGQRWNNLSIFTRYYLSVGGVSLFVWLTLAWISYFFPENMRELCLVSSDETYHHFRYSDGSYCRIDWMYLVKEPLAVTGIILVSFIIPALIFEGGRTVFQKRNV